MPESFMLEPYSWFQLAGPWAFDEKMPYCAAVSSVPK